MSNKAQAWFYLNWIIITQLFILFPSFFFFFFSFFFLLFFSLFYPFSHFPPFSVSLFSLFFSFFFFSPFSFFSSFSIFLFSSFPLVFTSKTHYTSICWKCNHMNKVRQISANSCDRAAMGAIEWWEECSLDHRGGDTVVHHPFWLITTCGESPHVVHHHMWCITTRLWRVLATLLYSVFFSITRTLLGNFITRPSSE